MTEGLRLLLLLFALIGFGGAGASLAVARYRRLEDGARDLGMLGVAGMLLTFGVLCTAVAAGLAGILAFGGVVVWASYALMGQHIGLFRIEVGRPPSAEEEETEQSRRAD
ncbi:MAG TPA: hypothetical protein VF188_18510 [Longimicrobiales bacterium]